MTGRNPLARATGWRTIPLLGVTLALALVAPAAAQAMTFTVDASTQSSDAPLNKAADVTTGDCASTLPSGACTVRSALQAASKLAGDSTVSIPAGGTYELTISQTVPRADDGSVGNLAITDFGGV